ncbi:catechol 2,3-dioxygenase-like lactoylglutathione lyase family enzyme [Dyadobacter sp. BE34]|uniref:Catechol 2,3-dioxygenase-like lactoylglutathione lyase family enzyme n=1 Tax=Dyadobacter fermentans TaxID=94254 RepID=A0ABU1QU36_9BACT|nr:MULTISPECIES: VOC family protein [Dyadobacter]MDR6804593.1 catechol 2,3-dioxygenase-like lactoylglutathione lyase family enzyme [Dyadobacter fermentans]MDR7043648.1 catechol 2,3-dioxygenase-like lactoylglutathione lyase family enzyme [Dyadobacter sp. BE242]MDR7197960.1 catechol 2,3-dioxygenase-like lactoylglutathione lyase family enzyme [Dyadobacter sp. BE34]MDR7214607.1 catechol 2,3-dioxygenase-like lactoylglutathione lyase family enzyme [Dyadobacter sp. BE31]MDR7262142.1 catechol 2,3-diox
MTNTKRIRGPLGIHIEGIQVILNVRDMEASRAFYKGILGFEEVDWGTDDFTSVNRENVQRWAGQSGNLDLDRL